MSKETIPTIEQSAAQQIGESIACWLAKKLDANKGEIKASISITCDHDAAKRITVEMKMKELLPADCTPFEFTVDDPRQAKLQLDKE